MGSPLSTVESHLVGNLCEIIQNTIVASRLQTRLRFGLENQR